MDPWLDTYEVWLPMPGQNEVPVQNRRYYKLREFTDKDDAIAVVHPGLSVAITKVRVASRTFVQPPT